MTSHAPRSEPGPSRLSWPVYLLVSAVLTGVCALVAGRYFLWYGRSFVWDFDGLGQLYPTLYSLNVWFREWLAHPSSGLPVWWWNLGLGADSMQTLAFVALCDPFAWLSLAFPLDRLEQAIALILLVRVVCAGVAVAAFLRIYGAKTLPSLVGVVVTVFGTWVMYQSRHPFFVNAILFQALLLIGVELAVRKQRYWPLVAATALTAFSNFVFFYMLTIVTVLYAAVRVAELSEPGTRARSVGRAALRVGGAYALGALLAAPVLVPALVGVLGTARSASEASVPALYSAFDYRSFLIALASGRPGNASTFLGFAYVGVLVLPVLALRARRHLTATVMAFVYVIFVMLPWFGSAFNGFSVASNRFAFSWALFVGLAVALVLSDDEPPTWVELAASTALLGVLGSGYLLLDRTPSLVLAPLPVAVAVLAVLAAWRLAFERSRPRFSAPTISHAACGALIVLVVANVAINSASLWSRSSGPRIEEFVQAGEVAATYERNPGAMARGLPLDDGQRIENAAPVVYNSSLVHGFPGTSEYYSVLDGRLTQLRRDIGSWRGWSSFAYEGFDDRAAMMPLLGVRHYVTRADKPMRARAPYGFTRSAETSVGVVFSADTPAPAGFVYDAVMDRSTFLALRPVDRARAMLDAAVVDDGAVPDLPRATPPARARELTYTVLAESGAVIDTEKRRITRDEPRSSIVLEPAASSDAEIYVEMTDVRDAIHPPGKPQEATATAERLQDFTRTTRYRAGGVSKDVNLLVPGAVYDWGFRDHLVNMGYHRSGVETIGIEVRDTGTVDYGALRVWALPVDGLADRTRELAAAGLRDVRVEPDRLSGTVVGDGGLLFLSVPYSTGWSATLDGEPVPTIVANTAFTGIEVPAGAHRLEMRYRTPGLIVGIALGAVGVAICITWAAIRHARRRRSPRRLADPGP